MIMVVYVGVEWAQVERPVWEGELWCELSQGRAVLLT